MITRQPYEGAWEGDVRVDGGFVCSFPDKRVRLNGAQITAPEWIRYPRIHPIMPWCAGYTQNTNRILEWTGLQWEDRGPACGINACAYAPDGTLITNPRCAEPYGPLGIRYVTAQGPVPAIATYADNQRGIYEYTTWGDITVGHGGKGPHGEDPAIILYQGRKRLLEAGRNRFVRFAPPQGNQLAIGFFAMDLAAFVVYRLTVEDIATLPDITSGLPLPPEPEPEPEPEPPSVPSLNIPAVTVERWTLDELKDGRELVVYDRENPSLECRTRVWIENGGLRVEMRNAAGSGRTGAFRPVKPCHPTQPEPPPEPEPDPDPDPGIPIEPPGDPGWRPSRDVILSSLRADIAMTDFQGQDTEWGTWEALWWADEKFAAFAARYDARDLKLVPCNLVVTNYRGVTFDYTQDLRLAKERLERCYAYGLIPMVCLDVIDSDGRGEEKLAILDRILPELREHIRCAFTAWELNVDGGASRWSAEEHARCIELANRHLGDVVLGVEFGSPADRGDPIIYDGRAADDAMQYWQRPEARRLDLVLLEIPYGMVEEPRRVCGEVGGAVCRLQGRFAWPDHWPEGDRISDDYTANWRADYGTHKRCLIFEYAAYLRWPSARKRGLREYVQTVIPISGFGEG